MKKQTLSKSVGEVSSYKYVQAAVRVSYVKRCPILPFLRLVKNGGTPKTAV